MMGKIKKTINKKKLENFESIVSSTDKHIINHFKHLVLYIICIICYVIHINGTINMEERYKIIKALQDDSETRFFDSDNSDTL